MDAGNLATIIAVILTVLFASMGIFLFFRSQAQHSAGEIAKNLNEVMEKLRQEMLLMSDRDRQELQQQLNRVHDQVYRGMNDSQTAIRQQFEQTSKIIQDVTQRLTTLDSTNKQVLDFSSQLQNLQNILKNPKQRGVLGEYWLETLLSNVLPVDAYRMQHRIGTDEATGKELIADAVIFIRDLTIAIDAKFSLENYNRMMEEFDAERREKLEKDLKADIKNRIDETSKYIQPQLGTMSFAFMFIPAEGVYYNIMNAEVGSGINSRSLIDYAFSKKVLIVSPTSFFAYLQTVLLGLRELQLEKSTQDIIKKVGELGKHFRAYADFHEKVGKNLTTVVNQYNLSTNELRKVSRDVVKVTNGSSADIIEMEDVTKPMIEQ